jgi:hypothetical protein
MDVHISTGQWISFFKNSMENAVDGTCFHLPSNMHYHAFLLVKNDWFPNKSFNVTINNALVAQ